MSRKTIECFSAIEQLSEVRGRPTNQEIIYSVNRNRAKLVMMESPFK